MAKRPRFKQSRRFGVNIFGHPKELKRGTDRNRRTSEYGMQLLEKQKLKAYYGLSEKQMLRYMKEATKKANKGEGTAGELAVKRCEMRLDNIVYRAGFASSLRQARQFVVHGHIALNGNKTDIPSHIVEAGDKISLTPKGEKVDFIKENIDNSSVSVAYISRDEEKRQASLDREPDREEIPIEVTDSLIVEFYSRSV